MERDAEALVRLATLVNRERNVETMAGCSLDELSREFGLVSAALFAVAEAGELFLLRARGSFAGDIPQRTPPDASTLAARAARTREPEVVADPASLDNSLAETRKRMIDHRVGALVAVPLLAMQRLVGVLLVARAEGQTFPEADVRCLTRLGELCAVSLENAQAFAREHQLRQELESSRAHLALAQEIAHLGSWEWDVGRDAVHWSATLYRIFGVTPLGRPLDFEEVLRLFHPEDRDRVLSDINRAMADRANGRFAFDHRIVRPDGTERVVHGEGRVTFDERGRPVRLTGTAQDITDRVRAEEAMRRNEESLRLVWEEAPIGTAILALDGQFLRVNRAFSEMVGYTPEELGQLRCEAITHPEDVSVDLAHVQGLLSGRIHRYQLPKRYLHKDGTSVHTLLHAALVRDPAGRPAHFVLQVEDVSEQRRVYEELARRRNWLEQVLDRIPTGVILFEQDAHGRTLVQGNQQAAKLFGHPFSATEGVEQFVGQICDRLGRPLTQDELLSSCVLRGQSVAHEEYLLRRPDGSIATVRGSAEPLWDDAGEVLGGVVVFDDVTELKDNERLRQEWMSVVAHDLRQPVTIILAYTGLIERVLREEAALSKLKHVENAARRLRRMIEDLLDVSRLEARRLELNPGPLNLLTLLRTSSERMATTFEGQPVELELPEDLATVQADPSRVEQILDNLLSNAHKYGAQGRPIVVGARNAGDLVIVWVRNDGEGIPPRDLPRLFSRFHRGDNQRQKGLGLGLYITRGLVEAQGGRVWVDSRPGKVTTFYFSLPALRADAPRPPSSGPPETEAQTH